MNGEFLGNRRTEIGISQNELSSILGYSSQLISLWESGKSLPSLGIWSKYASTLKLDLEGFLSGKNKKDNDYCDTKAFDVGTFASSLKSLRKEKGFSQKQLAEKVSANDKTISKWELGASLPSYQQFLKLCELYGLSYDELYFSLNRAPVPVKASKRNKLLIIIPSIIALASISANAYFLVDKYSSKRPSQESSPSSFLYFDDTYHWDLDKNNNKINVSEHRLESSISKDPTCVEYGEREYHCLECAYTRKENINPLGHTHNGSWYATEEVHYHVCTIDGEHFDTGNHEFDEGVIYGDTIRYTCKVCSYSKEATIDTGVYDGETYYYGNYPQSLVSDEATLESLNALTEAEENGYYLLNDTYYYKYTTDFSTNRANTYYFPNGEEIKNNTAYWFKVEPLGWHIISKLNGEMTLLSKIIIDGGAYDINAIGSYSDSNIRDYLNNQFYDKAFYNDDSKILVTEVENFAVTSPYSSASDNTFDKVYLPSVPEIRGFDDEIKISGLSEFARCVVDMFFPEDNDSGSYWTRSPSSAHIGCFYSYSNGFDDYAIDIMGLRPMIKISVN